MPVFVGMFHEPILTLKPGTGQLHGPSGTLRATWNPMHLAQ